LAKQLSIETLQHLIWDLRTELESLGKIVHQYERRIEALEKENLMLREKLAKYENPKNSNNSLPSGSLWEKDSNGEAKKP